MPEALHGARQRLGHIDRALQQRQGGGELRRLRGHLQGARRDHLCGRQRLHEPLVDLGHGAHRPRALARRWTGRARSPCRAAPRGGSRGAPATAGWRRPAGGLAIGADRRAPGSSGAGRAGWGSPSRGSLPARPVSIPRSAAGLLASATHGDRLERRADTPARRRDPRAARDLSRILDPDALAARLAELEGGWARRGSGTTRRPPPRSAPSTRAPRASSRRSAACRATSTTSTELAELAEEDPTMAAELDVQLASRRGAPRRRWRRSACSRGATTPATRS